MSARYESLLSRIHAEWSAADWERFRESACVPNPLTTLHEAAHWFQRQTLLERALYLVTVRALLENQPERNAEQKEELRKVIACRRLLSPISEGLALYTQFDYFPSNFFIGAGERSPYDAMIEFLLARRGFEETITTRYDLGDAAWEALCQTRLTATALNKKLELLKTPFLILDNHITGYLIIKASVARARCRPYFEFMHDGLVVPLIMSLFYNSPELVRLVLDPAVGTLEAIARMSSVLQERIEFVLDGERLAGLIMKTRGQSPDLEHSVAFDKDLDEFEAAEELYSDAYDALLQPIRSSLGEWIRPDQTVDSYLEETYQGQYGEPPYPLDAFQLLSSPHFGRLFTAEVTLIPKGESVTVKFRDTDQTLDLPSNSKRAQTYGWIRLPEKEVAGRLTEAVVHLHGLDHDFFRMSFISHERGLVTLSHNTDDYNIGWGYLADYLKAAYRIDQWLARINSELTKFEAEEFEHGTEVQLAKEQTYRDGVSSAVAAILPGEARRAAHWINVHDVFEAESDLTAYAALSLAIRIGDFSFESKPSLVSTVERSLENFGEAVNAKTALRFVSKREPVCCVQTYEGSIFWPSFSCLL